MITNLEQLKTALASWSERSDLSAQLEDFVSYAHQEIARTLRASVNTSSATVSVTGEVVAAPTRFRALKRVYLNTSPRREVLVTSADNRAALTARYSARAYPTHVSVEGGNLAFGPEPTAVVDAMVLYYAEPAPLTTAVSTNDVLTRYPFMYLYGALAELFRYIEDADQADRYENRFRGLITDTNNSEGTDTVSGPLQGVPYQGGIV